MNAMAYSKTHHVRVLNFNLEMAKEKKHSFFCSRILTDFKSVITPEFVFSFGKPGYHIRETRYSFRETRDGGIFRFFLKNIVILIIYNFTVNGKETD